MTDAPVQPGHAVPPRLAQLFEVVLDAAERSGQLETDERQLFFDTGSDAADTGVALSHLIDAYLRGAGELWEHLFAQEPARGRDTVELSRTLRRISESAVASLTDGFERAQRRNIRAEETARQELIDAVLTGESGDLGWFDGRAAEVDFPQASTYVVAAAQGGQPLAESAPILALIQRQLRNRYPLRTWISTIFRGHLVVIAGDSEPDDLVILERILAAETPAAWHIGIGDPCDRAEGIADSYRQAAEALRLALAFDLGPTVHHSGLLLYRLLANDRQLASDMYDQVIGPLLERSDGALLETLDAYVAANGNMARVARSLSIGPRTVAYRLDRIAQLTGHSLKDPDGRLTLELAARSRHLTSTGSRQPG